MVTYIESTKKDYLITSYRNLILGENIEMHSRELIAYELFEKQDDTKN